MRQGRFHLWTMCTVSLLGAFLLTSTSTTAVQNESLNNAVELMRNHDWNGAKGILETSPPDTPRAVIDYLMAICWAKLDNSQEALKFAVAARNDDPPLDERYVETANYIIRWAARATRVTMKRTDTMDLGLSEKKDESKDLETIGARTQGLLEQARRLVGPEKDAEKEDLIANAARSCGIGPEAARPDGCGAQPVPAKLDPALVVKLPPPQ
jgi:hypothetical protein